MPVSVFSKNWYRVETLKPRLKSQVEISSHLYRGERWYVLREPVSGITQRFSWQAYALIGLMDGRRTLGQLWDRTADRLQKEMPTQDEVIGLVSALYQNDMAQLDVSANVVDMFQRRRKKERKKWVQKAYSPLSLQVPLFDPTRLLNRICPIVERCLGYPLLLLYVIVVVYGGFMAFRNFDGLTSNLADRVLAADNLVLLWLLYPVIKIIHELGHAVAVRHYGGQVNEIGIMFLVFFPMPYVNATESASFPNKYHRMLVSAAGVLVELFIAAVAIIAWTAVQEGFLKSVLFNIAFMASVSTVLFNGNPLLKFDAYFVLSDYLEIPNLAKKAVSYWGYLCKKYLFALPEVVSPAADNREAFWLFTYNIASFAYRLFISISIILFVCVKYFTVGVLLAIWAFSTGWIIPLAKTLAKPFTESEFHMQGRNPILVISACAAVLAVLLFAVPLPYSTTVEGVVWVDEDSRLYAGESGFVREVLVPKGRSVAANTRLIAMENRDLESRLAIVSAQLTEARARSQSLYQDRSKALVAVEEVSRFEDELREIRESLSRVNVTSFKNGVVVYGDTTDFEGRYLSRGEMVGYVMSPAMPLQLKAPIPEGLADQVLNNLRSISVRSSSASAAEYPAELAGVVPQLTKLLPSPILADQSGGDIVLDPSSDEQAKAMENYLVIDIRVDDAPVDYLEERYFVKFRLENEPVFWRTYRAVRRVLLEYFET